MYNLILSGRGDAWDDDHFALQQDRYLEHTTDELRDRFGVLNNATIDELKRLPTIFAYERGGDHPARVGWVTDIRVRQGEIRIRFEFDDAIDPFTTADLDAHVWEFDVNRHETYRTHWAVKDVDLFEALKESGLGGDWDNKGRAKQPPYLAEAANAAVVEDAGPRAEIAPRVFRVPDAGIDDHLVAIMMPFAPEFDPIHEAVLAACRSANLNGVRADNIWENEEIIQDVFSLIYRSRMVVVDFTDKNPNVFYETGIAHTLGKPVVPITQRQEDVPFDLRHNRYLTYLPTPEGLEELGDKLAARVKTLR